MTNDKPKFTPGPWWVLREGSSDLFVEPSIGYWSKFDIIGRNEEEKKEVWQTKMANAYLIAAAPDMYKMLKRFATYFKERGFNTPRTCTLPTPEEVCNLIDEIETTLEQSQ